MTMGMSRERERALAKEVPTSNDPRSPGPLVNAIAVRSSCKGRGTASQLLSFAEKRLQERGWRNIRIDTHEKNRSMRRFLAKNGFVQCGSVIVGRWREPRIAYQKIM